ncbi:MAG: site-2 protease family protein [Coriobacteriia bacterium]|nr:site-2 protease family protein [Coriobacteriia bacterium]MBN2822784.1 site-2 protease family protein [Coriobacteriia bacterium]
MTVLTTIFWGVLTFSILVVLHEGGHFLAARAFKIKVHEFMIGLPGPAIRLKTKNMTWGITAIPLGGYVRIAGMEPGPEDPLLGAALKAASIAGRVDAASLARMLDTDRDTAAALLATLADWGAIDPAEDDDVSYLSLHSATPDTDEQELLSAARAITYRGAKTWQRITVLVSGVAVNMLTAIVTFTVVLAVWGYFAITPEVSEVMADTPAYTAGLQTGDTLTAIDGVEVDSWQTFSETIAALEPGSSVVVTVDRDGTSIPYEVLLAEKDGHAYLGVAPTLAHVDFTVPEALTESVSYIGLVFKAISGFFQPATFESSVNQSAGIVGIAIMASDAATTSPLDYAFLIALLSLSLGAMNILPIPPLDGGKVLVEVVEKVMGKPLSRNISIGFSAAGAMLLFTFIGYIMYADIARLVG